MPGDEETRRVRKGREERWMKLWQNQETGIIVQGENCPSNRHIEIPLMYEDELPEDMSQTDYDWWFDNSFVDIVRIGPRLGSLCDF